VVAVLVYTWDLEEFGADKNPGTPLDSVTR